VKWKCGWHFGSAQHAPHCPFKSAADGIVLLDKLENPLEAAIVHGTAQPLTFPAQKIGF